MPIPKESWEILLVEDSPTDADLTKEAFSESDLVNSLHIVEDGVEALEFLRRQGKYSNQVHPDVILLDLNLPKKNGHEVLAEIKNDPELRTIPVVILTTSADEEDVLKSYRLHGNCYITKPVDLERFIEVVNSIEDFWLSVVKLPSQ
ncbi:MAG: response regulator [Spirulinaceae cyanobacterium]